MVVRSRRYLHDGRTIETAVSYLPADSVRGTPVLEPIPGPGGIHARLKELGFELGRFVEDTSARMPLGGKPCFPLARGIPALHLVRTAYAKDGRPVEVCDTVLTVDAFQLSYELPSQ